MIEAANLTKRFDEIVAVDHINAKIRDGYVFGLIGTNGAGKSTFLRMASGVMKPDEGTIQIDGENVFENPKVKSRFFYISDDQHFFSNASPEEMMRFYKNIYPAFDAPRFYKLMDSFSLDFRRKIATFSKGMKKQLSVILGLCAGTDYIFCDETFDGLDPVMRQAVKSLFANDMAERNLTPIIASHNLRELEDVCDHVGIMHHGKVMLERSLSELQGSVCKIQVAYQERMPKLPADFEVLHMSSTGRVYTMIVKGNPKEAKLRLEQTSPMLIDVLPLTLEEIFIYELGGADYAVKDILL